MSPESMQNLFNVPADSTLSPMYWMNLAKEAAEYAADTTQRMILFSDVMRKRGNRYLEHNENGLPPVLAFEYEVIMDGRDFKENAVNYALARIIPDKGVKIDSTLRPIVVIDPRAGHGPGIGGSKEESEIGQALKQGRPTYFVLFFPDPVPGQTLDFVQQAEVKFLEEVQRLHPKAPSPSLIGNCQAGWASALIGADRPDVTGTLILAGSPLSYWSGVDGANPMRYKGGMIGGAWMTSLLCDLGNGKFDGANLVHNFEDLNPANTMWSKEYNLYCKVDTEEQRYLDFERWWGGYFTMNAEEISFIVESLFVGNKLEQGELELSKEKSINLKNMEDPVVVFASEGDNITPPQQALNWIAKVYGSVDEIKRLEQVLVYMVHKQIGHLGIFVSSGISGKEHQEIIGSVDQIDFLPPGLYEMVIEDDAKGGAGNFKVRYEEREIEDILAMDDGQEDEEDFKSVAAISNINNDFYNTYISPFVKAMSNEHTAELMRQMHPLRKKYYLKSDKNPFYLPFKFLAPMVKESRVTLSEDNTFKALETNFSDSIKSMLELYKDMRDAKMEAQFKAIYGSPVMKMLFPDIEEEPVAAPTKVESKGKGKAKAKKVEEKSTRKKKLSTARHADGGFAEGVVRIMMGVASADHSLDRDEFLSAQKIKQTHPKLKKYTVPQFKEIVTDQSKLLQSDMDAAIKTLPKLLKTKKDRKDALKIAMEMAMADGVLADEEQQFMDKVKKVLEV